MERWATQELQYVHLGDERRKKRLIKIVENLAAQPGQSIPQVSGNKAATTAAYDFWSSPYFQPDDIRNGHILSTLSRIKEHNERFSNSRYYRLGFYRSSTD